MTDLFKKSDILSDLNSGSLRSAKVNVIKEDAFQWVRGHSGQIDHKQFDYIVMDFPDPTSYSLGKLYSTAFFQELYKVMSDDGRIVVQSTSPLLARKSYWCVAHTLNASGFYVQPYHTYVPSFGEWGFVLGAKHDFMPPLHVLPGLRYVQDATLPSLFYFPSDMQDTKVEVNRLNNQILARYYDDEWSRYVD